MSFGWNDYQWIDPEDGMDYADLEWETESDYYAVKHTHISCYDNELDVVEEWVDGNTLRTWFEDADAHVEGKSISFEVYAILYCEYTDEYQVDDSEPLFVKQW